MLYMYLQHKQSKRPSCSHLQNRFIPVLTEVHAFYVVTRLSLIKLLWMQNYQNPKEYIINDMAIENNTLKNKNDVHFI